MIAVVFWFKKYKFSYHAKIFAQNQFRQSESPEMHTLSVLLLYPIFIHIAISICPPAVPMENFNLTQVNLIQTVTRATNNFLLNFNSLRGIGKVKDFTVRQIHLVMEPDFFASTVISAFQQDHKKQT